MPSKPFPIPGGEAVFRTSEELAVKHRRAIQVLVGMLGEQRSKDIFSSLQAGKSLESLALTRRELELLLLLNEATVFAYLLSWTIPDPLPTSADDVGEMNGAVYDALMAAATKVDVTADGFSIAAIEDRDSPTGASVVSARRSTVAVRQPSDRQRPRSSRSTATAAPSA